MTTEQSNEINIALIAQQLKLHIDDCFRLGQENKARLEKMHEENRADMKEIKAAQAKMNSDFDQAKGGWKMVFIASSVIASIAAAGAWMLDRLTAKL